MARARPGGLGKGLDALFADNTSPGGSVTLSVSEIEPNQDQPRKAFDETALTELADSIRNHGVLQPLLVRPMPNGRYQLIAGERRWRAARMAGVSELPVLVREMTDLEASELALIENLQREDLNPVEEAEGYRNLMDTYGMTQEQVSESVGKSRSTVANSLRLLHLPDVVLKMVSSGEVSAGHAKALLSIEDPDFLIVQADKVRAGKATVRDIEIAAKKIKQGLLRPKKAPPPFPADAEKNALIELELALKAELGRKVSVKPVNGKKSGTLEVEFFDYSDLLELAGRLAGGKDEKKWRPDPQLAETVETAE